jgi:hypothetical protein
MRTVDDERFKWGVFDRTTGQEIAYPGIAANASSLDETPLARVAV